MTTPNEKRAPVQGYPGGIPWAIHLEAYEAYCKRWGPQPALIDLEGRNCRGGFGTGELDEFIPGWRDRVAEFGLLKTEVAQLRTRVDDYATEINRLRNVIQAACLGGTDLMLQRWQELFPDAPVPSVQPDRNAANAARYVWLRDKSEPGICAFYLSVGKAFTGVKFIPKTVDEAIDAAIAAMLEESASA